MKGLIRLSYRKILDAGSTGAWERHVWEDTHLEFYMQAQRLDPESRFPLFSDLSREMEEAAGLHNRVSVAAMGYIRQLHDTIPDITDVQGNLVLPFHDFKFEVIQSHVTDRAQHKVGLTFYSDPVYWLDTIGSQLLLASSQPEKNGTLETSLVSLQPQLSISHFTPN